MFVMYGTEIDLVSPAFVFPGSGNYRIGTDSGDLGPPKSTNEEFTVGNDVKIPTGLKGDGLNKPDRRLKTL